MKEAKSQTPVIRVTINWWRNEFADYVATKANVVVLPDHPLPPPPSSSPLARRQD